MLIYINNEKVQEKVKRDFGFRVPLYCVIDTTNGYYNSPLWYEMYRPEEKIIDDYDDRN